MDWTDEEFALAGGCLRGLARDGTYRLTGLACDSGRG